MKKLLFLVIAILAFTSCANRCLEVREGSQICNYTTIDGSTIAFLDDTFFAVLDSNLDATVKGDYAVDKISATKYRISLHPHGKFPWTYIDVFYRSGFNKMVFPDSLKLFKKTFYCNNLM